MTYSDLSNNILKVVKNIVPPGTPDITDFGGDLYDYGIDSLDFSNIFLALEEKYNVTISEDDMDSLSSINAITEYLRARL